MTAFQEAQKLHKADFKKTSGYFSPEYARADGQLFTSIGSPRALSCGRGSYRWRVPKKTSSRASEATRCPTFARRRYHGTISCPESGRAITCRDSQICCVNFLAPFAHNPKALAELFVPLFPSLRRLLPMEDDRFVAFEWIGLENYLCEPLYGRPRRSRGEYFTSADAAVRFHVSDGDVEIVLVDWKYTRPATAYQRHVEERNRQAFHVQALLRRPGVPVRQDDTEAFRRPVLRSIRSINATPTPGPRDGAG